MRGRSSRIDASLDGGDAEQNFWPSFADLTSTIALILFVLVLLAYIQNLFSGKQLQRVRSALAQTTNQLGGSRKQVSDSKKQLRLLAAELKQGQVELKLSKKRVEEQAEVIALSNQELHQVRAQVQGIGLLRLSVLQKVRDSLQQELGRGKGEAVAKVADNGNIVLDESLLFDYKSTELKSEGRAFVRSLARAFANVLEDAEVRESIDVIAIQGHADSRGSAAYNWQISAQRASSVLGTMFQTEPRLRQQYAQYFAASAFSEFRPTSAGISEEAHRKNRRIEISVALKDARVREVIDAYFLGQGRAGATETKGEGGAQPVPSASGGSVPQPQGRP